MEFISPTKGHMTFDDVFDEIIDFINEAPDAKYKLIVGSDSQLRTDANFVSAIVIHRVGKGARYFYTRSVEYVGKSLKARIYHETARSLNIASRLAEKLADNGHSELDVEIHLDIGPNGETKDIIKEIVGMVTGTGFSAKIKPDSFGASKVADKYTK